MDATRTTDTRIFSWFKINNLLKLKDTSPHVSHPSNELTYL